MASNYYNDYQDYASYAQYGHQQSQPREQLTPAAHPLPSLDGNRNVSFNSNFPPSDRNRYQDQDQSHSPDVMTSPNTTDNLYHNNHSTPDSSSNPNSPQLASAPNATNLNRNIGTLASRETKTTEKSNGTGKTSNTSKAAVALNFWDSLVPSRWAGLYLGVILVEAIIVITMVAIVFGMIEVSLTTREREQGEGGAIE